MALDLTIYSPLPADAFGAALARARPRGERLTIGLAHAASPIDVEIALEEGAAAPPLSLATVRLGKEDVARAQADARSLLRALSDQGEHFALLNGETPFGP